MNSRSRILFVMTLVVISLSFECVEAQDEASQEEQARATCLEQVAQGELEKALEPCRQELAAQPTSPELIQALARAEFAEGDAQRSAELWQSLIESEGWQEELAHNQAKALWRAAAFDQAEALYEEILKRSPSPEAHQAWIDYLMAFDRWQEASQVAAAASQRYPDNCDFVELWGIAEAGLDHDQRAAELIAKALADGCPRLRWTTQSVIPGRLEMAVYRNLLDPEELVEGLDEMDDGECLARFELLKLVLTTKQAPIITRQVLNRSTVQVRFAGLGLLSQLGSTVSKPWQQLLAAEDLILRKHTLRRIREAQQSEFVPLLEEHLKREKLPGNLALTQLTLGELLIAGDQAKRGESLLMAIPEENLLYPVARMSLSEWAEKQGEYAAALELIEQATAKHKVHVNPDRIEKLRSQVEAAAAGE